MRPLDMQAAVHCLAHIYDLEISRLFCEYPYIKSYGLPLAIAIQPQDQFISVPCMILHIFDYVYVVFEGYLLQVNYISNFSNYPSYLLLYRVSIFVVCQFLHVSGNL